jgi:hypothetical protein
MTAARIGLLLVVSTATLACRSAATVPEPGAALVRITTPVGATAPDELRAWVYDDSGRLWDSVRIPETGSLVITNGADLGTVLIQPGGTVRGALRVHVRAFAAGTRVLDGVLSMAETARDKTTFTLALDPAVPTDDDDDDVPDVIDDCPGGANPRQGGCAAGQPADAGVVDAGTDVDVDATVDAEVDATVDATVDAQPDATVDAKVDATVDAQPDATVDAKADATVDAKPDVTAVPDAAMVPDAGAPDGSSGKATGAACAAANECVSGFCADKVCCNTACNGVCQNCAGGVCQGVSRKDDVPECAGAMTCNNRGMCVGS